MKKSWWKILSLLVLIGVTIFFRFFELKKFPPAFYADEAFNGYNALNALESGHFQVFYPENDGREGLFINFQALLLHLFKVPEPWVLRSASAILGSLTVIGFFLLLLQIFKFTKKRWLLALLSALLLSGSYWHIVFSRLGFRAIAAPFFLVWSLYLLFLAKNQNTKTKTYLGLLVAGLVYGLGFHTYLAYRVTPLFIAWLFILDWQILKIKLSKLFKQLSVFVVGALLSASPLIIYFLKNPQDFFFRTNQISIFGSPDWLILIAKNLFLEIGMLFIIGDGNARHNYNFAPALGIIALLGLLIALIYWFGRNKIPVDYHLFKKQELKYFVYLNLGWLLLATLPAILTREGLPHFLRGILMIVPVFMLSGLGIFILTEYAQKIIGLKKTIWLVVVLMLIYLGGAYIFYFRLYAQSPATGRALGSACAPIISEIKNLDPSITKNIIIQKFPDGRISACALEAMFLSGSATPLGAKANNTHYFYSDENFDTPVNSQTIYLNYQEYFSH